MSVSDDEMKFCLCCGQPWPKTFIRNPTYGEVVAIIAEAQAALGLDDVNHAVVYRAGRLIMERFEGPE